MIEAPEHELLTRSIDHAVTTHTGLALDAALEALGWREALAADPRAAVSLLFEGQGMAGVNSSALDQLLAHHLGLDPGAVILPALGDWKPPAVMAGGRLRVHGVATDGLPVQMTAVAVAQSREGVVAYAAEPIALPQHRIAGMDPELHLIAVEGPVTGATEIGPVDWAAAAAAGQLAIGHQLVGASRRMLELARQHALDRVQFGQPIARFQAVRHRLADALVAIEAARAALDAAWCDGGPALATLAKATAGRAAHLTAKHCQQVLAGVGFTTEHPLHHYVRRVYVLDQLLGAGHDLSRELGRQVLSGGSLPPRLPL